MLTDDRTIHDILSAVEHSRIPPLESVKAICTRVLEAEARVKVLEDALTRIQKAAPQYVDGEYGHDPHMDKEAVYDSGREMGWREAGEFARKALEEASKDPL